jgi:hypothetical protein
MFTTVHTFAAANRKRANTKPCSSSAKEIGLQSNVAQATAKP